jgi:hypothetical protein
MSDADLFIKALQRDTVSCPTAGCAGPVDIEDVSPGHAPVKTFRLACARCGWRRDIAGRAERVPPWDDAALLLMADAHLMHQQPTCPYDGVPVVFTSLPNPRRRARYRVSCFYCGRMAEMDWPPSEARR